MKIFVSYSRSDSSYYAQQIHEVLTKFGHSVFTDVNSIPVGKDWSNVIEENISKCDVFVIIITPTAFLSKYIQKEITQAQKENKRIIPCIHKYSKKEDIKWGITRFQGIEFDDKSNLALDLYAKIEKEDNNINYNEKRHTFIKKWQVDGIPYGIAVDTSGFVYVTDVANHRIQKFDSNGTFIAKWGSKGSEDRQFENLKYIAVDTSGFVYLADSFNKRIQKFRKITLI